MCNIEGIELNKTLTLGTYYVKTKKEEHKTSLCFMNSTTDATVGLENSAYTVTEGGDIQVCAIVKSPDIECPINYQLHLIIHTSRGSAGIVN